MVIRSSISAVHDALAGSPLGAPVLGAWQFTQQTDAVTGYPNINHGLTFSDGAVTENALGDSGLTITLEASPPAVNGTATVSTGSRAVLVTMDINTIGTGNHSAFAQLRNTAVAGADTPFPGSIVGTYGQGSEGDIASVVIPAGTTVTVSRRGGASANNQRLQAGSFIRIEELA